MQQERPNLSMQYEREGKLRYHTIPARSQIVDSLNAICPPQICPNNNAFAVALLSAMVKFQKASTAAAQLPTDPPEMKAPGNIISKAVSYAIAKAGPTSDPKVLEIRLDVCRHGGVACPDCRKWAIYDHASDEWKCAKCDWSVGRVEASTYGSAACPAYVRVKEKEYCKGCNCPEWKDAELPNKANMKLAECPRKLWPKEPEKWQQAIKTSPEQVATGKTPPDGAKQDTPAPVTVRE